MAIRTIQSPNVEIRERDLSLIAPQNVGTNVFITGYTSQGPMDEVLQISSKDELEGIYGIPTNSAERYFYHGVKELLTSPATIYTYRLPYGPGTGDGFGSNYSALVYPVNFVTTTVANSLSLVSSTLSSTAINDLSAAVTTDLDQLSGTYVLGNPVHLTLTESQYNQAQQGINWQSTALNAANLSSINQMGYSGVIILNKAQTIINSQFEGFYVGIMDNSNINPATNFTTILGAKTVSVSATTAATTYTTIPNGTLEFGLSSNYLTGPKNSISQVMENLTDYNIDGREDDDLLNVGVFKLRKSLFATEAYKLDYVVDGAIVGSIDSYRKRLNPTGGPQVSFFLESEDTNDRNVEILVNPYISNIYGRTAVDANGIPQKKVRVLTNALYSSVSALSTIASLSATNKYGVLYPQLSYLVANLGYADNLYPLGAFSDAQVKQKDLGSIPSKVERALDTIRNDEIYDIDVVVEAGLGTIYASTKGSNLSYYDDTEAFNALSSLRTSNPLDETGLGVRANYSTIFNLFENFCNLPSNTGGRGDCMFIADPIRHIMISGKNTRYLSDRSKNFQTDIFWAMRHQFELENTSYAAMYANWAQTYDEYLGDKIWVPFSSVAAASFARNDAAEFPWSAPAGYTRGLVSGNVIDIAVTPNQKQRDELYKTNFNPVLFSPSQGIAIFGQKTLSRKPSAFDRINVRRLFLALERPTKKAAIFYVFEPNNEYTRTRFVNTLTPLFEYAKQNGGLYDYLIVCDERNNTPQVIDSNELVADIYIKPTRTAEFIICQFTATRTDANFLELV
jgi:hypothetical protein